MLDRCAFLAACSTAGLARPLFPGVLWGLAADKAKVTADLIDAAAHIADVPIAEDQKQMLLDRLNAQIGDYEAVHKLQNSNAVAPALVFDPVLPGRKLPTTRLSMRISAAPAVHAAGVAKNLEEVAFSTASRNLELQDCIMPCFREIREVSLLAAVRPRLAASTVPL